MNTKNTRGERLVDALRLIDTMDTEELRTFGEALKMRWNAMQHEARAEFKYGDLVQFDAGRRGFIRGQVVEFNRKSVVVIAEGGRRWRVAPTLLRKRSV